MNHYEYLEKNFNDFLGNLGYKCDYSQSLIIARGDKCYSYKDIWKKHNIEFHHGVAIYLLTYLNPWDSTCRQVGLDFIQPFQWVIDNYPTFKKYLP